MCASAVKTLLAHIHPLLLANTPYPGNYICTAKYRTAHRARSCLLQNQNGETKGRALDKSIYRRVRLNGLRLVCGQPHANPISLPLSIDDEVILLPSPLAVHSTHSHLELGYAGRPVQDQKQPIFQDQTKRSPSHNRICPVRPLAHTSPFSLTDVSSLETRIAAQDTIERLHGQMVRGWNDPGCRISVRFADSAEQRELRVRWISSPLGFAILTLSSPPPPAHRTDGEGRRPVTLAINDRTGCPAQPPWPGSPRSRLPTAQSSIHALLPARSRCPSRR